MENWIQYAMNDVYVTCKDPEAVNMFYISAYFTEDICNHMFLGLFPDTEKVNNVVLLLHGLAIGLVNNLLACNASCVRCLNNAMSVLKHASFDTELVNSSIGLPGQVAMCLANQNGLTEAISFSYSILNILNESVGESHQATLDLQNDLSALLVLKGKYAEATVLLQSLHEINSKHSGTEETTLILVTAANELYELSKYEEAFELYQAIFGERKVSETKSNIVLIAWKNYAFLLKDKGKHTEALNILKEVIQYKSETLKLHAVEILKMKSSIAHVHLEQKELVQAVEHYQEAFHEMTDSVEEDHQDTQIARQDIGIILQHTGNYDELSEVFESEADTLIQTYNEYILNTRANLAGILMALGHYDRAMEIYEDLYLKYKTKFGEMHKETLQIKSKIGFIYHKQGKLYEAKEVFQEIFEGFLNELGPTNALTTKVKTELKTLRTLLPKHTATIYSAVLNDENAIINFIENDAYVNEEDTEGKTLLHHAAQNGYTTAVEKLLEKGAMYNYEEYSGKTPVQLASNNEVKNLLILTENVFQDIKNGNYERVAHLILTHNGIINTKDEDGYSLLHWAVYKSCMPIVTLLLDNRADVRCVSNLGYTVLHIASSVGSKKVTEVLLQHMVNNNIKELIDAKTAILGNTALHIAAANGHLEIIRCLLKNGATFNIQNNKDKMPVLISKCTAI
ncbi:tankyrase [Nephila pilipes]|uniref:Tankyrase n=1 Tax=Nephila pilipes TaxID=299642 RepID=A0A8X6P8J3_NEPPI|nr:tankyrase [Nephila pilipes]